MAEQTHATELTRLRIHYARGREMRYVGNLDLQLVWERTFRRAGVPIAFSQGFSPRPRFHIGAALPLGFTSTCELLDVWLTEPEDPADFSAQVQASAPPGLLLQYVEEVGLRDPALQVRIQAAGYRALPGEPIPHDDLNARVTQLLEQPALPRVWREKPYDLRPRILSLALEPAQEGACLSMTLSAAEGATGRPEEVLAALGLDPALARVERTYLHLSE